MADVKLTGNANWSTFKAGVTNGDTVYMNGYTLTIDEAITAYSNCVFTNASGGTVSASAGGYATLGGNYNVTLAGVTTGSSTSCFRPCFTGARTATLTLGTVTSSSTGVGVDIATNSGGSITFVDTTFTGGATAGVAGLSVAVSTTLVFTNCTATGGAGSTSYGILTSSGTVNATGTLHLKQAATAHSSAACVLLNTGGTWTLSGDVEHRSAYYTLYAGPAAVTYTITSEAITGSLNSNTNVGLFTVTSGTLTITRPAGSLQHHSNANGPYYLYKASAGGVITCNGDITCGTGGSNPIAFDGSPGSGGIFINGTVTGPISNSAIGNGLSAGAGKIVVRYLERNSTSGFPVPLNGNVCFYNDSTVTATIGSGGSGTLTLVSAASAGDYPSAANVRSGTSYAYGALTGTCAVPGAASVASGVSVDATTGTAVLTSAVAQSACNSALAAYETNGVASQTDLAGVTVDLSGVLGYLTSILAIFSGMTSLPNWIRRLVRKDVGTAGMITAQSEINTGGTATFDGTTDSLEAISDSSGTGARTITITVNDGITALQNAIVRLSEGVNTYTATTNASGVATFNVDDATYTVAITKSGYSYSGTTLVVDGTETVTYSMTQITITPGSGDLTTGYFTALDGEGSPEASVSVYVEMTKVPSGDTGYAFDSEVRTITSAADGTVTIEGLIKGATYRIYRGKRSDTQYLIPTSAGATYELPSIIGREQ